jgi:NitT/TauT family transport system substrate-binding protein
MRNGTRLFPALLCAALLAGCAASAVARENIRVAYPSTATVFLPLWVARDVGFFQKHGAGVELVSISSSSIAMASLLAGDIDVIIGGANPGVAVQLQGNKDITLFAGLVDTFLFSIFSQPNITRVPELKGKRMAVTRFGGSNDFAGRYFLRGQGLEPNKDVTLVQIGRQNDILGALFSGSVHAGVLGYPSVLVAKKQRLFELADLTQKGPRYQLTAFVAKKSFLKKNGPAMEGFIKAVAEAIYYLKTNRAQGLKILGRHTRIDDPSLLGSLYDFHVDKVFPRTPEIDPESLRLIFEELSEEIPRAKSAKPEEFIDNEIIARVKKSGFFAQLYR